LVLRKIKKCKKPENPPMKVLVLCTIRFIYRIMEQRKMPDKVRGIWGIAIQQRVQKKQICGRWTKKGGRG
jgi:hypothetical protein